MNNRGNDFTNLIAHMPIPTLIVDSNNVVLAWNTCAEQLTGISSQDATSKEVQSLGFPTFFDDQGKSILHADNPLSVEITFSETSPMVLEITASELQQDNDTKSFCIACIQNITEKKHILKDLEQLVDKTLVTKEQMEKNLVELAIMNIKYKESENRFRSVWENSTDNMRIVRQDGIIIAVNKSYCNMVGMDKQELEGEHFSIVYAPSEERELIIKQITDHFRIVQPQTYFDQSVQFSNGKRVDLEVSHVRVEIPEREPVLLSIFRDITEKKKMLKELQIAHDELELRVKERTNELEEANLLLTEAKEKAEIANKTKSVFLANMSHELRTPLNGILGLTSLLLSSQVTKKQYGFLNMIRNSGESLLRIINDILDISKVETGGLAIEKVQFDFHSMLHEAVSPLIVMANTKSIRLHIDIDETIPTQLIGDSRRIKQVILNLLSNALKFTDTGSVSIEVTPLSRHNNHIELKFAVIDTGIGIESDKLDSIFQMFNQVDDSYTRKYGGTGLGLAISKKLVHKMGGKIWAESLVNEGSKFYFTCSLEIVVEQQDAKQSLNEDNSFRILYADDSVINQEVLLEVLKRMGWEVDVVASGEQAIQKYENRLYHLILLDIHMPGMDGFETAAIMREMDTERDRKVPILALTARELTDLYKTKHKEIIDDFISKSLDFENLVSIIAGYEQGNEPEIRATTLEEEIELDKLDLKPVFEAINKKRAVLDSMISHFENSIPQMMIEFLDAIHDKNIERTREIAHAIKSSLTYFRAEKARKMASKIENISSADELEEAEFLIEQFEKELESIKFILSRSDLIDKLLN